MDLKPEDVELSPALQAQEEAEAKGKKAETAAEAPASSDESEPEAVEQPEVDDGAENEPEKAEDEKPKKRGKSAEQRIDELTKARREAERRNEELEARLARLESGQKTAGALNEGPKAPDPNDSKYEFGEADTQFLADMVDYRVEKKLADERESRKVAETSEAEAAAMQARATELNTAWAEKAAKATDKYPDFTETVVDSAKAGEWDLLPLSAAAVQGSDVGDDIAYHLATHPEEAKKLADAERGFHQARNIALQAGLPPEVVNLLAAPHLMRGQEIFESIEKQYKGKERPKAKVATDAPEPPKHTVRGGGGKFTQDWSSDDCDLSELNKAIRG